MYRPLVLAMLISMLTACGSLIADNENGVNVSGSSGTPQPKVRFIVLGDTGAPSPDGESANVAKVIEQVCALRGCDFSLGAGDNIYEMGAVNEYDPLFTLAFQQPYANLKFPFYMALGNHDNSATNLGEGGVNLKGDVQVAYTLSSQNTDQKWNMPARYYNQTWPKGSATPVLELFVLDSSPITHFYDDPNPQWGGATLDGLIVAQKTFINDALALSKARWKFALAHHPYISNGDHGNAGSYETGASPDACTIPITSATCRGEAYKAFVEETICNKADVFFTGHDHNLFWLMPVPSCGKTHHILSGAASKERSINDENRNPAFFQSGGQFGFFWVELDGNRFTGAAYVVKSGGIPNKLGADGKPAPDFEMSFTK